MRKVLFILGQLTDADADWLSNHGQRLRVPRGQVLIRQGTRLDTVYIVLEGLMTVEAAKIGKIAQVSSGDILGEMSMIDSSATAASITADSDALVLAIPKRVLVDKLETDVGFAARFYRALALFLADRMRNTISRMGYGSLDDDAPARTSEGELDESLLDNVHLAGARFERMLRKLSN